VPTLTYLHGFMWYIEDLEDLAEEEHKDLEHYNKKYKLLVAAPLKEQLEKDENE